MLDNASVRRESPAMAIGVALRAASEAAGGHEGGGADEGDGLQAQPSGLRRAGNTAGGATAGLGSNGSGT